MSDLCGLQEKPNSHFLFFGFISISIALISLLLGAFTIFEAIVFTIITYCEKKFLHIMLGITLTRNLFLHGLNFIDSLIFLANQENLVFSKSVFSSFSRKKIQEKFWPKIFDGFYRKKDHNFHRCFTFWVNIKYEQYTLDKHENKFTENN